MKTFYIGCRDNMPRPVERIVMRPGPGWRQLNGSVWEHDNGIRVHTSGRLVRLKSGAIINHYQVPGGYDLWLLIYKLNGRNQKRAMMAFALTISAREVEYNKDSDS